MLLELVPHTLIGIINVPSITKLQIVKYIYPKQILSAKGLHFGTSIFITMVCSISFRLCVGDGYAYPLTTSKHPHLKSSSLTPWRFCCIIHMVK